MPLFLPASPALRGEGRNRAVDIGETITRGDAIKDSGHFPVVGTMMDDTQEQKKRIREQAYANRNAQENKDALSQEICAKFVALPVYGRAKTVMYYLDVRSEV